MEAALSELRAILQRFNGFRRFGTRWVMGDSDVCGKFRVPISNGLRKDGLVLGAASAAVAEDGEMFSDRFGVGSGC
jgi:hypothetical protein